jgi:hypothetical protein
MSRRVLYIFIALLILAAAAYLFRSSPAETVSVVRSMPVDGGQPTNRLSSEAGRMGIVKLDVDPLEEMRFQKSGMSREEWESPKQRFRRSGLSFREWMLANHEPAKVETQVRNDFKTLTGIELPSEAHSFGVDHFKMKPEASQVFYALFEERLRKLSAEGLNCYVTEQTGEAAFSNIYPGIKTTEGSKIVKIVPSRKAVGRKYSYNYRFDLATGIVYFIRLDEDPPDPE